MCRKTRFFSQADTRKTISNNIQSSKYSLHFPSKKKLRNIWLKRTYYRNDPRDQLFRNHNKYFALRILSRSRHNSVLIYFFVNKYVYFFHNMPNKRRLVTYKVCFVSEKAGLLDHSYNKCALIRFCTEKVLILAFIIHETMLLPTWSAKTFLLHVASSWLYARTLTVYKRSNMAQ